MDRATAMEIERANREKWYERFLDLCIVPRNRRALIYGSIMTFLGQMTGVNRCVGHPFFRFIHVLFQLTCIFHTVYCTTSRT